MPIRSTVEPRRPGSTSGSQPDPWRVPLLLVLAVGLLFALRPVIDTNVEFHLHGGQWMLEQGAVPQVDTYTYAARGRDYVDLHWLFQLGLQALYRAFGFRGLSVAGGLLTLLLLIALAARMRRRGAGPAATGWVLLAAAVIMNPRYLVRPENVSFLYLAGLGVILDRHEAAQASSPARAGAGSHRASRWLWLAPPLHLLWVNTQGLFPLGWIVLGVSLLGASLRQRRLDRPLAAALGASVAICLANPYFLRGFLFPLELLSRSDRSNIFAQTIVELQPLWSVRLLLEDRLLLLFALGLAAALLATFRRRSLPELLLPAVFAVPALLSVRNVPLFVIVAAPVLAPAFTDAARSLGAAPRGGGLSGRVRSLLWPGCAPPGARRRALAGATVLSLVAIGLGARIVSGAYYHTPSLMPQLRFGWGLDRTVRPVGAGEFLLRHGLDGRILNSSNIGGWLGWVLPQPVYLDGRLEVIGEELFREEVASWSPGGLAPLIAKYDPQLIVLDYLGGAAGWADQLRGMPGWRLLYLDEVAAVYAIRGYATDLPGLDLAEQPRQRGLGGAIGDAAVERVLRRPVASRWRRWLDGFRRRRVRGHVDDRLGHFCAMHGAWGAAERFYLACLARDPDLYQDIFDALGAVYLATGRYGRALLSYDRAVAYAPRDPAAHNERGLARAGTGDLPGAIGDFSRAIALDAGFAEAYFNRALARQGVGDLPGAAGDYARALEANPGLEQARRGLEQIRRERR